VRRVKGVVADASRMAEQKLDSAVDLSFAKLPDLVNELSDQANHRVNIAVEYQIRRASADLRKEIDIALLKLGTLEGLYVSRHPTQVNGGRKNG